MLSLWWQGIHDETEKAASIGGEDDNDIVRVKDAKGGVILTMSFHSEAWRKDRDNKELVFVPREHRPQEDWVTGDTHEESSTQEEAAG